MKNSNRPNSSWLGMGDFALSAMNYRKMKSIERQNDFTSSALEEIRDIQRFSMSGIISLHNEIEELSRTQWHILDHLTNIENKEQILGNLKLILVHTEEQFQLIEQMSREYPEFAALLSMNLKNMLEESNICLNNLKMMSIADIKWAKQVLDDVNSQHISLHSNSETIQIDKVLMLDKNLEEISELNEDLTGLQSKLEEEERIIETLGKKNEEYVATENEYGDTITDLNARIASLTNLASYLSDEIPAFMYDKAPPKLIEVLKNDIEESYELMFRQVWDYGEDGFIREDEDIILWEEMVIDEKRTAFEAFQSQIERDNLPKPVKKLSVFFRIILPCLMGIYWYFFATAYRDAVLDTLIVPIIIFLLVGLGDFIADNILILLGLDEYDDNRASRAKVMLTHKYRNEKADLILQKRELKSKYSTGKSRYNEIEKRRLNEEKLNQKIETKGNELSEKWATIQHLVPNNPDSMT
jgi:hypothetical protein